MLDNYKMSPYPICLGIIPAALPLVSEKRVPHSEHFKQPALAMVVIIVTMVLNSVILMKRNSIEKRFREWIGPVQVNLHIASGGGKMHPALEHMKGVGA